MSRSGVTSFIADRALRILRRITFGAALRVCICAPLALSACSEEDTASPCSSNADCTFGTCNGGVCSVYSDPDDDASQPCGTLDTDECRRASHCIVDSTCASSSGCNEFVTTCVPYR